MQKVTDTPASSQSSRLIYEIHLCRDGIENLAGELHPWEAYRCPESAAALFLSSGEAPTRELELHQLSEPSAIECEYHPE
jgi:hypothetical protein